MNSITCTLSECEERIDSLYEEGFEPDQVEIRKNVEEGIIVADEILVTVPQLGFSARMGEFCNYDEGSEEFYPDFSITLVYSSDNTDPDEYLYWEQDGIVISLYNMIQQTNKAMSMSELSALECTITY